jgi:hypothetical protein
MPQANLPASDFFVQQLADVQSALRNLGSQGAGLPVKVGFGATVSTTSTSPVVSPTGSPIVKATLGVSGDCIIQLSATMFIVSGSQLGVAQVLVDGIPVTGGLQLGGTSTYLASSLTFTTTLGASQQTVAQGPHTFSIEYSSTNGGSIVWENIVLTIQPL